MTAAEKLKCRQPSDIPWKPYVLLVLDDIKIAPAGIMISIRDTLVPY